MRKRRRLADKLTIMVCAVLVAVSAFFYAPMDVSAEEVLSGSESVDVVSALATSAQITEFNNTFSENRNPYGQYYLGELVFNDSFDLYSDALDDVLYEVSFDLAFDVTITPKSNFNLYGCVFKYGDYVFFNQKYNIVGYGVAHEFSTSCTMYVLGSDLKNKDFNFRSVYMTLDSGSKNILYEYSITNLVVSEVSNEGSDEYQNGYNAGYSAGVEAGYGNGYSEGFADGEASVDTGAIYDEAFQAGKDSVDTQSYYDAGYQAGYQVSYQEGYESGYDEGYQSAMDRIDGWGADTSDYPILKFSFFKDRLRLICDVFTSVPSTSYDSSLVSYLDFDINPNHTYKFSVNTGGLSGGTSDALYSDFELNFVIGSNTIKARNNFGNTFDFYIPGFNMGSSILLEAFVYDCVYYGGPTEEDGFLKYMGHVYPTLIDCYIDIYDMGPSGDTQNHIANQTDSLTNGFDNSQGNSVNSDLSSGLNEYQTSEDTLWATATTGLKDFTFFDFASVPAMITGMSFITAIMGSWFNQAGGASGVGIVLSILFSVVLVAMVLGLYRWYQSRGGKE